MASTLRSTNSEMQSVTRFRARGLPHRGRSIVRWQRGAARRLTVLVVKRVARAAAGARVWFTERVVRDPAAHVFGLHADHRVVLGAGYDAECHVGAVRLEPIEAARRALGRNPVILIPVHECSLDDLERAPVGSVEVELKAVPTTDLCIVDQRRAAACFDHVVRCPLVVLLDPRFVATRNANGTPEPAPYSRWLSLSKCIGAGELRSHVPAAHARCNADRGSNRRSLDAATYLCGYFLTVNSDGL